MIWSIRRRFCITSSLTLVALSGCVGPNVTALHDPLYRASRHSSTITAIGTDTRNGINSITISATEGTITACNGLTPSLIPCRTGATSRSRTCFFAAQKSPATCTMTLNLGDRRLVTYTATARNAQGRTAATQAITYAGGAPLTQAAITIPIINISFNIPWETARPVWWHTSSAGGGSPRNKIDVGFFPDADWGANYQGFTGGMQTIARGAFFDGTDQFSSFYRVFKHNFNLWAGPAGGNGEDGCVRSLGGAASTVSGAVDGKAIIHQNAFRDCADIALGGLGTTQSTLTDAAWVFTHESGHFLHGLGDEYDGGGNGNVSDPPNTWNSQASCQSAAPGLGLQAAQCSQIGTTGWWRVDNGQNTTMEDRVLTSDWRTASGIAVSRRIVNKCGSGNCY